MIHNDVQNQLQLLIKTSAPPLIEVAEHATSSPQWTPGQRLPAHVLANLPNGRFEVRVGDQVLDLNLPRNTQPGDSVDLVFVGSKPRLTFALAQDIANLAPAKTSVALSETAKFIGTLIQRGAQDNVQVSQLAKAAPVVASMPASANELAQSLRQAVSQSGLFYESHQAQWLGGERSLATLLQEPQGQLSPLLHQGRPTEQPAAQTPVASGEDLARSVSKTGVDPVHPQTSQLVQQQLHTLDSRQVIWQGQVWPGQDLFWQIDEEGGHGEGDAEQGADMWSTRLSLQLPSLGDVSARIAFVEGAVRIDIRAGQPGSVALMRSQQTALAEAFEASGLHLAGVNIGHETA